MKRLKKCLAMLLSVIMILSLFPAAVGAAPENSKESAILSAQDRTEDVDLDNTVKTADEVGITESGQIVGAAPTAGSIQTADALPGNESALTEDAAPTAGSIQTADALPGNESALPEDAAPTAKSTQTEAALPETDPALTEDTASTAASTQTEDTDQTSEEEQLSEVALPVGDISIAEDVSQAEEVTAVEVPISDEELGYESGIVGEADQDFAEGEISVDYGEESVVGASTQSYEITVKYGQTEARSMLAMINNFRQSSDAWYWDSDNTTKVTCSGLSKLTYDYELEKAAMVRAMEIAVLFSHTRPNGNHCRTALQEVGYSYTYRGENIAAGYPTAQSVFTGWREDNDNYSGQGHRRNMLSKNYNRVGIGHVYYNGRHFWTQEFAYNTSTISATTANDSNATCTLSLSDTYITSASGTASPSSVTVGVSKTCALPEVTMTLTVQESENSWANTVKVVPTCTWTSKNSSIAAIKSGKLSGVKMGSTTITTTVNGVTISVPVTVNFEPLVVGDNVTAQIVLEGSSYVLYFNSQNGTLWNNWKSIVGSMVSSVNTIKLSSDSGKMYLPANSSSLFSGLSKLKSIDLSNVDSSKVTNAKAMFSGCSSLTTLNLSNFNLSSVTSQTNANDMFKNCTSLATINTPKKTNASVNMMLPATFVDDNANQLVRLPINASSSIKIIKYSSGSTPVVNLSKCTATLSPTSYTYNGSARKPSVTVKHAWTKETAGSNSTVTTTTTTTTLSASTDYTVAYSNNVNAGTATVMITGKGSYTGTIRKTFAIAKASPTLKFASSTVSKTNIDDPFTNTLTKTTDGTVTFKSGNTAVATVDSSSGKVTITGIGTTTITATAAAGTNYNAGSAKYTLKVVDGRIDISTCTVTLSATSYTYNGSAKKPTATVKYQNATLTLGTDYTVAYSNNVNVGEGKVTVTGTGKYKGSQTLTFKINQAAPTLKFASSSVTKTNVDAPFTNALTKKTDGTVTFKSGNTAVATVNSTSGQVTIKGIGTATITVTATAGTNYKAGSAKYTLTVVEGRTDLSECTVTLNTTAYTYSGSAMKPTATVKYQNTTLTLGTDYTVAYSNNVNVGEAKVTVTGTGKYKGSQTVTFKINQAAPTLKFASSSVSKTNLDASFTNALTKKTDGTVTFKSSKTSVATVNSTSGLVTIKGIGTATITATAAAGTNYKAGSAKYTLTVTDGRIDASNFTVTLGTKTFTYNGKAKNPSVTVKYQNKTLTKGTDYTVSYSDNVNAGEGKVTVTGKGNYKGSKVVTFTINKAAPTLTFASSSITKSTSDVEFTNEFTTNTDGGVTFASGNTDVAIVNPVTGLVSIKAAGTTTITATVEEGTNYKSGSKSYTANITQGQYPLTRCTLVLDSYEFIYNGKARKPKTTIWHLGSQLTEGTDYTVSYTNNVNAGTATVTVTGKEKYGESLTQNFRIVQAAPTLKFARSSISKTDLDKAFTNKLTKKTDGTVTFKSANKSVATVNSKTGKVTIKGVGTTTITATAAAGKNYKAGSAKYTLKVTKKVIVPIYRLFNTRTGEHFYTDSTTEKKQYLNAGNWVAEGIAWYAPKKSSEPIYRLSNPNNGNEHHYTKSKSERDWLVSLGWHYDKVAWYSDTDKLVPIYRHYHPIQRTGNHHYTTSKGESDHIVKYEGWRYEGISFYVSKAGG